MMLKNTYILLTCLLLSTVAAAQPNCTRKAYEAYQNKEFEQAAELIDECIATDEGANDAQTWHIRGFIYKDIYKEVDNLDYNSEARGLAVESFAKSLELDESGDFKDANIQSIKYLATMMYNDCVNTLSIDSYETSEMLYHLHKETLLIIQPDIEFRTKDIEYYNALASIFDQQYDKDHTNKDYLWKTLEIYKYVLSLDPNDYGANYNSGILYYNEGVEIIKNFDPEMRIDSLLWWQDSTAQLFRIAEPFMLKAYSLNENRIETPHGLSGIYYSLGEDSLSTHYKLIEEKLKNNPELTLEEKEEYYDLLIDDISLWLNEVMVQHPAVTPEKAEDYLQSLNTYLNDAVETERGKGSTLYFRDKFTYKQELKQTLVDELERLITE